MKRYRRGSSAARVVVPNSKPALPPSGDRLGALLDAAVDPMVLIDTRGLITGFNRAAEQVFGYAADEVIGDNVSRLMDTPHRGAHDGYIDRYLGEGRRRIIGIGREVMARRRDGSLFPIDLSVGEFRNGDEHGFVGILRDISQRKAQEAALRLASEELRLIFENTPTAVAICEVDGRIAQVNRACEALLGQARAALIGEPLDSRVVDEDRQRLAAALARVRASDGRDDGSCEVRYRLAESATRTVQVHAGLAHEADGRPRLLIVELVDRSALDAATREAEDLRARLAHVNRLGTLGEMVSGIAHEVNQPLTAIANYANAVRRLLLSGRAEPAELATILEKIASQAERAGQVIRGLRSMTRKQEATRSRLDCNALVVEVTRLMEFELRDSGVRLQLELAPALPPVLGDGVQIQQVVLNLIHNAIEAMAGRRGERVTVATSAVGEALVEIRVTDRGPGLPPELEDRLFEPFFTTKAQGMGLGLSICKSIVAAHGGELVYRRVEPEAGGGAEFTIRLPTITE